MEKLGVLICTIDDGIRNVEELMLTDLVNCDVMVFHQISNSFSHSLTKSLSLEQDKWHTFQETGLSRNRNHAIALAQAKVSLLADDDVRYNPGFDSLILDYHRQFPQADIITFEINERSRSKSAKYYWHNRLSILRVNSPTISFKTDRVQQSGIQFNENFGIGSDYPCGEENLFLHDCLVNDLKLLSVSVPICSHPDESTGQKIDAVVLRAKRALFRKIYGRLPAVAILLYFAITKRRYYQENLTIRQYLEVLFSPA